MVRDIMAMPMQGPFQVFFEPVRVAVFSHHLAVVSDDIKYRRCVI